MYWLCMIATIPLATGNKLNCFISASGMLAIVWHCVLLFCCFFWVCFFVDFLHVNKSSSQKKKKKQCSGHLSSSTFDKSKLRVTEFMTRAFF